MVNDRPRLLISDRNNRIYDVPDLEGAGMKGGEFFRMDPATLVKLPKDSELFMLPDRTPVGYDSTKGTFLSFAKYPFSKRPSDCYAVAAFMAPGYTACHNAAYSAKTSAKILPLFSYAAVVFYKNDFYVSCVRTDRERRQSLSGMDPDLIKKNIKIFRDIFPANRLVRHLETCALTYGCPAAKNFFLSRYEGPLPSSRSCNAVCIGCISHQKGNRCMVTQPRIKFTPSPEEIADAAVFHIKKAKDPVVSFGQGCEGEPLLVGDILVEAVKLIRKRTQKGIINLNTNASRPLLIKKMFHSGLDSIRVSINSVRKKYYEAYYRPIDYKFSDVIRSIKAAKNADGFVSINYLVMPGFTDLSGEVKALRVFLEKLSPDMIQWRNLNYDHLEYFRQLKIAPRKKDMVGMKNVIDIVKKYFPGVMNGYFNPSRNRMARSGKKRFSGR